MGTRRATLGTSPDAPRPCASYYRALLLLEARFPIGKAKGAVTKLSFAWCDSFRQSRKASAPDLQLEKAAVLFNVGAAYAAAAGAHDRGGAEGLKAACAAFQAAAGAFEALREGPGAKLAAPATPDLSGEAAAALGALCLAQAQECVYDTAVATDKSGALQAKLARGAAAFWEQAASALGAPPLRDAVDGALRATCLLRSAVAGARAAGHAAAEAAKADDKATEAARLAGAVAALRRELKSARGVLTAAALAPAAALEATLAVRAARAERDAEAVYMVRVPAPESLPPLQGMPAVKPTPLAPLLDASKEQLLRTVVPDGAAKALSRYSSAVDELTRDAAAALADASDAARLRLRELELPDLLDAMGGGALPPPLLAELAEVSRAGGVAAVRAQLPRLGDAARACAAALAAAGASLATDAAPGGGAAPGAPPLSPAATAGLRAKIEGYEASLAAAARSDAALAARVAACEPQIATLDPAAAAANAPRLLPPLVPSNADAATAPALRATLAALEANAAERAGLEDALKEMKQSDDILPRLMAAASETADAVFEEELKKCAGLCSACGACGAPQLLTCGVRLHAQVRRRARRGGGQRGSLLRAAGAPGGAARVLLRRL